ncbi:DNA mismatch repair endonuclease MutL [Pasteurellaceae bacterium LIM206]|nr:DNA mismatch repair endonuclease MutL [Pasteurellaceae bacterium LIM206]
MPIQILPPQLANQIAAGEVVERPASVVKELVENSLDAGATQIRIDIENGGATLIRIRDNGIGIAKQELALALARHATSKIATLEDLDTILSLGFRGEALASISSVSRLTLTSRTAEQNEAWQVYAQGRDMETTVKPASHPVGTTVEVANLFFNTPARRKFLRTDKTEFAHIDEVIRRIALAKPAIGFTLSHNGKPVRQYRTALDQTQQLKRVAAICGEDFVRHALQIDWKHDELHLHGWIAVPQFIRPQNDLAYCYINGRMVRDKVINHAIRQAYAEHLPSEHYPAFVLFLDLNPTEVDVNVHPTKHEVRFHQSRLIHDFICQGIENALGSTQAHFPELNLPPASDQRAEAVKEPAPLWQTSAGQKNRAAAGRNMFERSYSPTGGQKLENLTPHFAPSFTPKYSQSAPTKTERQAYRQLMQTESMPAPQPETKPAIAQPPVNEPPNHVLRALALVEDKALLLQQNGRFYLLPLEPLQRLNFCLQLLQKEIGTQPLLIPVVFRLNEAQQAQWAAQKSLFAQAGFEFSEHLSQQRITLNAVPTCLRQQNLQHLVLAALTAESEKTADFVTALCEHIEPAEIRIFSDAVTLLTDTEQLIDKQKEFTLQSLLITVDFNQFLTR